MEKRTFLFLFVMVLLLDRTIDHHSSCSLLDDENILATARIALSRCWWGYLFVTAATVQSYFTVTDWCHYTVDFGEGEAETLLEWPKLGKAKQKR